MTFEELKDKGAWDEFVKAVLQAKKEAYKEKIQANAIVINTNLVKIPSIFSHDGVLPPMICGLEIHVTEDELPDNYSFAIMQGSTERERLVAEARKETAKEILQTIKKAKENGQIYYNDAFMNTAQKAYGVEVEE